MSRSGYNDDIDTWQLIRWRGAVASAIKGKRGQSFLRELLAALDAMPIKRLVANELETPDLVSFSHWGLIEAESVCALGAVGKARGIDMSALDPEDMETVVGTFNIADAFAREIVWMNDEGGPWEETPEHRFDRIRAWVAESLSKAEGHIGQELAPGESAQ